MPYPLFEMNHRTAYSVAIVIWVLIAIYSAVTYQRLPEMVVTHWDINGKPDGWSPRMVAAVMMPTITVLLIGLLWAMGHFWKDALPSEKAKDAYAHIVVLMTAFMAYIQALILDSAVDPKTQFGKLFTVGIAVFFFGLGYVIRDVPPNQLMGFRTPATIADPVLWRQVHEAGGKIMMYFALAAFVGALIGLPFWAPLGLAVLGSLAPLPYMIALTKRRKMARTPE